MFVLIKSNGPAVYLAVYLAAGSNKQLPLLPYYCQPRWRLRAYQQISNPALLSRIYMFRNIGFWTPKPIKLANMLFQTNKLRMVMSCNWWRWSLRSFPEVHFTDQALSKRKTNKSAADYKGSKRQGGFYFQDQTAQCWIVVQLWKYLLTHPCPWWVQTRGRAKVRVW